MIIINAIQPEGKTNSAAPSPSGPDAGLCTGVKSACPIQSMPCLLREDTTGPLTAMAQLHRVMHVLAAVLETNG